jgi:hypothetical protein
VCQSSILAETDDEDIVVLAELEVWILFVHHPHSVPWVTSGFPVSSQSCTCPVKSPPAIGDLWQVSFSRDILI